MTTPRTRFAMYSESKITGCFAFHRTPDGLKLMAEVEVERHHETVTTYRTYRPATPEDCERAQQHR